jgi:hypothetical protein
LKKAIVLTEMVGYNCFIIFQYYYLNIKYIKFWNFMKTEIFENFEILIFFFNFDILWKLKFFFLNIWKFFKYWSFLKILNFKFLYSFLLILEFWNFMKFLKELFPFWGTQWVVYRETIGLLPGKQLVNFHKTLKFFQVMWFNLSQWEVSEV